MKKFVFIAICVLGLLNFSSCRSTSNPCGLAENSTKPTKQLQQPTVLVISSEIV